MSINIASNKELNLIASKIKADETKITTEILNLISDKDIDYENYFRDSSGGITRTITKKGHHKENLVDASIQTNQLNFNNKDITKQLNNSLSKDNILKVISSQENLSIEQINQIETILTNKEWNEKTKTLTGVGSLIVQAIVTYITAGAGSGLVAGISNTALKVAATSVISNITSQVLSSVVTGNSLSLDVKSIAKGAITAGVLSYANSLAYAELNINTDITNMTTSDIIGKSLIDSTTQTAISGGSFKDNLLMNTVSNIGNKTFAEIGDYEVAQLEDGDTSWSDGSIKKTIAHSIVGGTIAELQGGDFTAGALSAGAREILSPISQDFSKEGQILSSQLTGIVVGGLVDGDEGAELGYNIATSGERFNRQLHQDEIKLIKTKNALELKEVLAETSPNLSQENVNYLYEQTQKAMVDESEQKILDKIIEKANAQGIGDEVLTVITEAQKQIRQDAKGNVYVDLQGTPTLVPMMDTNNYYDPRYYPSSTVEQNVNIFTSATLNTTGLVTNPVVSGIAWGIDTGRNVYNDDFNDLSKSSQNTITPGILGFPLNKPLIQKAGAGLSYYNLVESISDYNNKRKVLEWQKNQTNSQELVNIYSNPSQVTENIDKNIYNKANTISIKPSWLKDVEDAN